MPGPKQVRTREAVLQGLPPLLQGPHRTKSTALHDLNFIGPLREWPNFLRDVIATDRGQEWSTRVIKYTQQGRDLEAETVLVPDEHGVQGRFQQSIGQVMGMVLDAQGIDAHFADFKSLGSAYKKTPDVITINQGNVLRTVGELKVPWVEEHHIKKVFHKESQLRVLLAQIIDYMQDLNCKYGFLSTYDETIFLRQHLNNGSWEVQYSPVIAASAAYIKSDVVPPIVSARQCFFHLACLAETGHAANNNTPKHQWVVDT